MGLVCGHKVSLGSENMCQAQGNAWPDSPFGYFLGERKDGGRFPGLTPYGQWRLCQAAIVPPFNLGGEIGYSDARYHGPPSPSSAKVIVTLTGAAAAANLFLAM